MSRKRIDTWSISRSSLKTQRKKKRESSARENPELSALLAITETATHSLDPEKVLNDTLDKSLEILEFDAGYIRVLDPTTRTLVIRVARGISAQGFIGSFVSLDSPQGSVGRGVIETRKPFLAPNILKRPGFQGRVMANEGIVSAAWIPVMSQKRVLGVMVLGSSRFHRFLKNEIDLLMAFGSQLGAALENAQLY